MRMSVLELIRITTNLVNNGSFENYSGSNGLNQYCNCLVALINTTLVGWSEITAKFPHRTSYEGNNYVELLQNINVILILIGMKHLYQTRQQADEQ